MELIDYTNKWVSGEIMEDFAMVVGGVVKRPTNEQTPECKLFITVKEM